MRAAVLREFGQALQIEDVRIGKIAPDEVLIRTAASGVCHSDRHAQHGHSPRARSLPIILGHESAGIVEAIGSAVTNLRVGDRVMTCAASFCGTCEWCERGHQQHCTSMARERPQGAPPRFTIDGVPVHSFVGLGGFATLQLVNERAVARIPEDMPLERAALLGCAVMTGIGAVKHTAQVRSGENVVVIGCGGVGLNVIQGARLAGAERIVAIDVQAGALERARIFGATDTVDASKGRVAEAVVDLTNGGADHVFEVVGRPDTIALACDMARVRGIITVIGLPRPGERIQIASEHLFAEKRIQGSKMGRQWRLDVPDFCRMYLSKRLLLDELASRTLPLSEINTALDELETSDFARTVIAF